MQAIQAPAGSEAETGALRTIIRALPIYIVAFLYFSVRRARRFWACFILLCVVARTIMSEQPLIAIVLVIGGLTPIVLATLPGGFGRAAESPRASDEIEPKA